MKNDKISSDKLKELKREFAKFSFVVGLALELSLSETNHIESSKDLDKYISEDINFSDVKDAIENNDGLSTKDKKRILNSVVKLEKKVPYLNVKSLYKNCEKLKIMNLKYIDNDYAGVFRPGLKMINLKCNDPKVFNHELLHATNNLYFNSGILSYEKSFDSWNSEYSFLKEGFNEWFNSYVFETNAYCYLIQVADIKNFKSILKRNDKEFIEMFINGNYKDFVNDLEKYLNKKDADELMGLCSKEFSHEDDSSIDEINRKYSIMAKAYINSMEHLKLGDEYVIFDNLHQSYKYYKALNSDENALKEFDSNMYKKIYKTVKEKISKEMTEKLKSKLKHRMEFGYDKKYEFLNAGFIGWINTKFLDKESTDYKVQAADFNIFQTILKMNSDEFVEMFMKDNNKDFTNALKKYIDKEEVNELMNLCSKEYKNEDNTTLDDIDRKYLIMLKAYMNSLSGQLDFNIYDQFYSSYKNYKQLNSNTETLRKFDDYMIQKTYRKIDEENLKRREKEVELKLKHKAKLGHDEKYDFLDAGFNEWFNTSCLSKKSTGHRIQSQDLQIFCSILKISLNDLVEKFTSCNNKDFIKDLEKYMDKEEVTELINLCSKEFENEDNTSLDDIYKKYSIMIKALNKSYSGNYTKEATKENILLDVALSYNNYKCFRSFGKTHHKFTTLIKEEISNVVDSSSLDNKKNKKTDVKVKFKK